MEQAIPREKIQRRTTKLAKVVLKDLRQKKAEARNLRKEANYVDSTPRCGNCVNMQSPLQTQHGISTGTVCRLLVSHVARTGLCDWWTGADGSTLEG